MNFMAVVEDSKLSATATVYDQAAQNYNAIARRRESRFMQMGASARPAVPRLLGTTRGA